MERISGKKSNKNKEIKNVKRPKGKKLISSRNFVDSFRIARQNERNIENVIELASFEIFTSRSFLKESYYIEECIVNLRHSYSCFLGSALKISKYQKKFVLKKKNLNFFDEKLNF